MLKSLSENLQKQPKRIFLIDGFGALLSAFLLGVVLVQLEDVFGIPPQALYVLAAIPCFFVIYDVLCYWFVQQNFKRYIAIIAILNILYCIVSIGYAFQHIAVIKTLGWVYILGEIALVFLIGVFEYKTSQKL